MSDSNPKYLDIYPDEEGGVWLFADPPRPLTPAEAREIAQQILDVADAAERVAASIQAAKEEKGKKEE